MCHTRTYTPPAKRLSFPLSIEMLLLCDMKPNTRTSPCVCPALMYHSTYKKLLAAKYYPPVFGQNTMDWAHIKHYSAT